MKQLNIEKSLVEDKIISAEQLQTIKLEQQRSSVTLVGAIRRLKFVPEDILIGFLSRNLDLLKFNLQDFIPSEDVLSLLPNEFAWKEKVLPLFKNNDELTIGILDPLNVSLIEEVRFRTGLFIKTYLVKEDELNNALNKYYDRRRKPQGAPAAGQEEEILEEGSKPSVVQAVNLLLAQALKFNASDVHIEPHADKMRIRLRIDGVLKEVSPPGEVTCNVFVSRIKIMSNLDIAEKRQPQDGRFKFDYEEGSLDVRVSVIPTILGESIVLRLLRQNKKLLTLQELGMSDENLKIYSRFIRGTSGIILVTGPTGSGKSTTLYASLSTLKSVERNIITIEDPVEYQLDFCRQIQVNPKVNLTFAAGLRSILRHDPDVIMVGEIRDLETATIAIQAALTGHIVFSSLHTNDAASAVTRLIDMGIEPFLIASCLNGVVAQRLIRTLCAKCKKRFEETGSIPEIKPDAWQPVGCQDCLNTGYSGRIGIFEVMEMTSEIGRLSVEKASSEAIVNVCRKEGKKFLYDDGLEKVKAGLTSTKELMRVLGVVGNA